MAFVNDKMYSSEIPIIYEHPSVETMKSNAYVGNKSLYTILTNQKNMRRRKRAAINEEVDLAVLMQGENTNNKIKIATMIASGYSTPESFDESVVSSGEISDARLLKSSQRLKNMIYDLKVQDSLDGSPRSKHTETILKHSDPVDEDGVSELQIHDVKQELRSAKEEWDLAQEESLELMHMRELGNNGFGLISDRELRQRIHSNTKALKTAKRRLLFAKEQAMNLKLDLGDEMNGEYKQNNYHKQAHYFAIKGLTRYQKAMGILI